MEGNIYLDKEEKCLQLRVNVSWEFFDTLKHLGEVLIYFPYSLRPFCSLQFTFLRPLVI